MTALAKKLSLRIPTKDLKRIVLVEIPAGVSKGDWKFVREAVDNCFKNAIDKEIDR